LTGDACGLIVAYALWAAGVPLGADAMSQRIPLHLTLQIQGNILLVQMRNPGDHDVRVWDLGNSWGGASWSLRLTDSATGRKLTLRPTNQGYTRNLPKFIEVPANDQKELRLTPSGREWTAVEDLAPLRVASIHVQAVLEIAPSTEAREHRIATGRVESEEVLSQPPHTWLFGASTDR
jgi:hypothetical protein